MVNNKIKVFHYDDSEDDLTLIPYSLNYIAKDDYGIEIVSVLESSVSKSIEKIKENNFDLIILDMLDQKNENKKTGIIILDYLKDSGMKIPVIIYTGAPTSIDDFNPLKEKYDFIVQILLKRPSKDEIKKVFSEFLERNELIPIIFSYDSDNYDLKAEVNSIGSNNINTLLVRIKRHFKLTQPDFKLNKITSGLSGACIFRVEYDIQSNTKSFLLKVSRDKDAIRKEFINAEFYKNLPAQFRLEYNTSIPKQELENEACSAILIEYAENASTFFDWLMKKEIRSNESIINSLLTELFLNNGLTNFYSSNKSKDTKKYNYIFAKLDERRISFIKKAINDLRPILTKSISSLFDEDIINQIIFSKTYKNITYQDNKNATEKNLILSHGDFHAKNLLISSTNRPTIIDTGGFCYDYWCSDISRLIVHLFIEGIDNGAYDFFDNDKQIERVKTAKEIIEGKEIAVESDDSVNNGFIHAINWLRKNAATIHSEFYSDWEFQLNIGLEFLKASYKTVTLPPCKRVLALLSACEAFRIAEESISKLPK